MKIGYIMQAGVPDLASTPLSGPAIHVVRVCMALQVLGHQVTVLAFLHGSVWKACDFAELIPISIGATDRGPFRLTERVVRRTQRELQLPYIAAFESIRFAAACVQELDGYDILYERQGWMGYGGVLAARRMRIPLVLEVNGDHLAEYEMLGLAPRGIQRRLSIAIMRWATRQTAFVVATGEGWRRRFLERWPVDPERVAVVENGSEMVELLARPQLRAFQEIQSEQPVRLVYIGAFEPWHGVSVLMEAMAKAVAEGTRIHLDLIGDGTEAGSIRRSVDELGLSQHVTLHGYMTASDFAPLLGQADIGLSPYCGRVEYSGLKLLDYKAAGLAVIASGADSEPAVLRHGETGWIVPPCDVEALAAAIVRLATTHEERRQIGRAARCDAEAMHSWRHTAEHLDALFRQVVQP